MISHFETGVRGKPSADNLVKLANALEVSIDYLLGRTEEPDIITGGRVEVAFRSLSDASGETIDAAIDVIETLVGRDKKRQGGG